MESEPEIQAVLEFISDKSRNIKVAGTDSMSFIELNEAGINLDSVCVLSSGFALVWSLGAASLGLQAQSQFRPAI